MTTYTVTRFCCLSGLCSDCHQRENHGDRSKRARVVQANHLSSELADRYVQGWKDYEPLKMLEGADPAVVPATTPIEQLVSILQQNQFVDMLEVLVPEQCAMLSLFGKNLHITVQEVEG
jgi:hypothetical protein